MTQPLCTSRAHACPAASAPAACAPPKHTRRPARGSLALRPALLLRARGLAPPSRRFSAGHASKPWNREPAAAAAGCGRGRAGAAAAA